MRKCPNHRADDQAVRHNGAGCRQNGLVAQLVSAVSRQQRRQRTEYNVENRRRRVEDVCNQAAHEQTGNRLRQHHRQHRERFGETELNRPIRDMRKQQRQRGVERGDDGRETEGTGGQQLLKHRSTPFFAGVSGTIVRQNPCPGAVGKEVRCAPVRGFRARKYYIIFFPESQAENRAECTLRPPVRVTNFQGG